MKKKMAWNVEQFCPSDILSKVASHQRRVAYSRLADWLEVDTVPGGNNISTAQKTNKLTFKVVKSDRRETSSILLKG